LEDKSFNPNALAILGIYRLYTSYFKHPDIACIPDDSYFIQAIHDKIKHETSLSIEEISEYVKIGYYISQYISMSSMNAEQIEKHNSIFFNSYNSEEELNNPQQNLNEN